MTFLKSLMKTEKKHAIILEVLFILYLLFNVTLPLSLANFFTTKIGVIIAVLLAISMFSAGLIAGILALLVAYTTIKRANLQSSGVFPNGGAEEIKMEMLNNYNKVPKTLEEEVVDNMAPIVKDSGNGDPASYKPVLNPTNDSAPINYTGVI